MITYPTPILQTLPNGLTFEMIPVGPGWFMMGSEDEDAGDNEQPVHKVRIDYTFAIGKYPVTQALWLAVMQGENPSYFKGMRRPVEQVSWYDVVVFCNALSELCNLSPVYFEDESFQKPFGKTDDGYQLKNEGQVFKLPSAPGYRLPSEAEWEYAARGGTASSNLKYAGSQVLDETGWYEKNSHHETRPVGLKLPNELGVHDMSGNVFEWCEDHWHSDYNYAPDDGSARIDRKEDHVRVGRGGHWSSYPKFCRVAYSSFWLPAFSYDYLGFRVTLAPGSKQSPPPHVKLTANTNKQLNINTNQ